MWIEHARLYKWRVTWNYVYGLINIFQYHLACNIYAFVFLPTGSALTVDPLSIHSLTTCSDSTEIASRLIPGTFTSIQLKINMCAGSDNTKVSRRLIPGTFTSVQLNTGDISSKLTLGPFLTLSVRYRPSFQSYLFQSYISLNPSQVEQSYTYMTKRDFLIR